VGSTPAGPVVGVAAVVGHVEGLASIGIGVGASCVEAENGADGSFPSSSAWVSPMFCSFYLLKGSCIPQYSGGS
jgi:hypothetical protein